MTATTTLPTSIRARVHEDAIGRVTRFFNASTEQTLAELFQNARRAGATRIDVRTTGNIITVTDDGKGIEDPAALLAFGQSAWDNETSKKEDPAGMGVYSLARQPKVTIRSRVRPREPDSPAAPGWQVQLTPEHFLGQRSAAVDTTKGDRMPFGTEVKFQDDKAAQTKAAYYKFAVQDAAKFFPLPVTWNGEEIKRLDFLHDARHIEEWDGIRIGVYSTRDHTRTKKVGLNFHGVVVEMAGKPVYSIDGHWYVKADIIDCPALELVLPARKEIVETPFVDELRRACRAATYRAMLGISGGVDVSAAVREDALALGVKLPIARPDLEPWTASFLDEYSHKSVRQHRESVPDNAVVMEASIPICDQHTFQRALERAGIADRFYHKEPRYQGYQWYDGLVKATAVTTTFTTDGKTETIEDLRAERRAPATGRPEGITFTIHTVDAAGRNGRGEVPADVAFGDDGYAWAEDVSLLVTRDSKITPWELAELVHDAYFNPSEDGEADSYETQENQYRQSAESAAIKLLNSAEEAIITTIRNALLSEIIPCVPRGREVRIIIPAENAAPEVVISPAPPADGKGGG